MSAVIMLVVLSLIFFGWLGWFAWSAWSRRFGRSRLQLLVRLVECIGLMIIGRQLVYWGEVPVVWFVAVALLSAGVAGVVMRWRRLPWLEEGKRRRQVAYGSSSAVIFVGLAAVVLS